MGEAKVVAEVKVGLCAIVCHIDFAMLERAHGAGIDVKVGIELHHGNFKAFAFKQKANARCGNAFAEGGDDASCYEDEFWAVLQIWFQVVFCLHNHSVTR